MNITPEVCPTIRQRLDWLIILSTLLILLGGAALLMPSMAILMAISTLGWILLASRVVRIIQAPQLKPMQGFWLNLLVGILYTTIGIILFGLYAGISMMLSGVSLLAIAAAVRNTATERWS